MDRRTFAFFTLAAVVMGLTARGIAQSVFGEVATELGAIETQVRTGVLPGMAGILMALVTIAVGVAVVGYFTRGR